MTGAELEAHYRAYLAALNERRFDDLVHFVQDEVTYNGEVRTRQQYQDMIAGDAAAIPDLVFDPHLVVAVEDQVACRLVFDCTRSTSSSASPRPVAVSASPNTSSTDSAKAASPRFRP